MAGRKILAAAVCLGVLAGGMGLAQDVDLKAAAKAVADSAGAAVVPLKIVTSTQITYEGREWPREENESEVLGTVLDETGLIVTSNTAANPAESPFFFDAELKVDSQVKGTKLIRKDGTEVALKIVLRDKDLDLMFLRPEKKIDLPHVGLKKKGPELALGDHVITLSRLGAVGDRQPRVAVGRVQAVVDKPRRFYVAGGGAGMALPGCPVFTAKGELVGIGIIRAISRKARGGFIRRAGSPTTLPVVLPVADVLEDMEQIEEPEAEDQQKQEEKKPEEKAKEEKK